MNVQSMHALKEWNAQIQTLLQGQYAVLIRKGGIIEKNLEFEIEHREFFLYPTYLHQNKLEIKPEHLALVEDPLAPEQVHFTAFARVKAVWKVEDLSRALRLEPLQALNQKAIERRFLYRNKPYVHVLLLEVSRLEQPFELLETPEMLGCLSWVPLDQEHLGKATSVLPEAELHRLYQELQSILGGPLMEWTA